MAEMIKGRKLTMREILDEIADDEEFSPEERQLAREKSKQIEALDSNDDSDAGHANVR